MLDYISDDEEDNPKPTRENIEFFFENNNDLQNDDQIVEQREEQRSKPREEVRVEIETPTPNKNLEKKITLLN